MDFSPFHECYHFSNQSDNWVESAVKHQHLQNVRAIEISHTAVCIEIATHSLRKSEVFFLRNKMYSIKLCEDSKRMVNALIQLAVEYQRNR